MLLSQQELLGMSVLNRSEFQMITYKSKPQVS